MHLLGMVHESSVNEPLRVKLCDSVAAFFPNLSYKVQFPSAVGLEF